VNRPLLFTAGSESYLWALRSVRVLTSLVFLMLGLVKLYIFFEMGLKPYESIVSAAGLPEVIKYYGITALVIEFYLAVGLWNRTHYQLSIVVATAMTTVGSLVGVALYVFKLNSECGCGLLGDNELFLLIQKGLIITALYWLYKNKHFLFSSPSETRQLNAGNKHMTGQESSIIHHAAVQKKNIEHVDFSSGSIIKEKLWGR